MVAKTPAKKAPAKRKPRAKKPVDHAKIAIDQLQADFGNITSEDLLRAANELIAETNTHWWWIRNAAFGFAMLTAGVAGGWWSAGGVQINPGPGPSDIVSTSFDEYETLWRAAQVAAADKLDSGEFTKSQQVTEYRSLADGAAIKQTRQPLLEAEYAEFGGDKWTVEKASKVLRGYGR